MLTTTLIEHFSIVKWYRKFPYPKQTFNILWFCFIYLKMLSSINELRIAFLVFACASIHFIYIILCVIWAKRKKWKQNAKVVYVHTFHSDTIQLILFKEVQMFWTTNFPDIYIWSTATCQLWHLLPITVTFKPTNILNNWSPHMSLMSSTKYRP
jgi:hypothetical protein